MTETFLFVSSPSGIQFFEESKKPFARVEVLAVELDKISGNGRVYRFQDAELMRKSLIGKRITYGISPTGKHLKKGRIGFIESARIVGKKIFAILRIIDSGIIESLKAGARNFLCSVGGVADKAKLVLSKAKEAFIQMIRPRCTHIQFWQSNDGSEAGFPSAKMTRVLEFQESVFYAGDVTVEECDMFGCRILTQIRKNYEFEEAKRKTIREMIKRKTINIAVAYSIAAIIREPWQFIEEED